MEEEQEIKPPRGRKPSRYARLGIMEIEEIMPLIGQESVHLFNYTTTLSSSTLQCFKHHGTDCQVCGLKGEYFVIEIQTDNRPMAHASLIGIEDGREMLFTKDHIIPKCVGGPDAIDNVRTCCSKCNSLLGAIRNAQMELTRRMGYEVLRVNIKGKKLRCKSKRLKGKKYSKPQYYPFFVPLAAWWPGDEEDESAKEGEHDG